MALARPSLALALLAAAAPVPLPQAKVFPMAVWYGGGKARAPMLEREPRAKKEEWRRDVRQIRALGFNTLRCWIDWATGEPSPGEYRLDTLDVLLSLAEEEGLAVIVQVALKVIAYRFLGRYDEPIAVYQKAIQLSPKNLMAHLGLTGAYSLSGRDKEASAHAKEILKISPDFSLDRFAEKLPFKNQAEKERYINALRKAGLK